MYTIKRNSSNYKEVNAFFNKLYKKRTYGYSAMGTYMCHDPPQLCDYMHYPKVNGTSVVKKYVYFGYKEISLKELKTILMQKNNEIPENWYIVVTEENREVLRKWLDFSGLNIGQICGMVKSRHGKIEKGHNPIHEIKNKDNYGYDFGNEITFEQFKKEILKENTVTKQELLDDNTIHVICKNKEEHRLLSEMFPGKIFDYNGDYTAYCTNRTILGSYAVSNYPKYKEWTLVYFKDIVENNKKIIGYKLIKPEYKDAVLKIAKVTYFSGEHLFCYHSPTYHNLKDAGVLDLWFEPVYEEEIKEKSLTLCNDGIKITITSKQEIKAEGKVIKIQDLRNIYKSMQEFPRLQDWIVSFPSVTIGCSNFTSGQILTIIENYEQLNK